jgi:two-component system CheB/CheR fusion protein
LSTLLEGLAPDSGIGFVVVTHLDPQRQSHMPELLAQHTSMPIGHAEEGQKVRADHIYVIPPNVLLTIEDGVLHLGKLPPRPTQIKAIDVFMRHLARDQKSSSVGIVLTGFDADGSIGLKQIKAEGGMVMVQEPSSAEYDGMPRNAVATGLADFVLPVEQMGSTLIEYVRNAGLHESEVSRPSPSESGEVTRICSPCIRAAPPISASTSPA